MDFQFSGSQFFQQAQSQKPDENKLYDVLIIGAGPAGYTAALYCLRKGMSTAILANNSGGKVTDTHLIENFTGILSTSGTDFAENIKKQLLQFPVEMDNAAIVTSILDEQPKIITLADGRKFKTKALIIATGTKNKQLNIPGEKDFLGKGVSYCAICDAPFFKDKTAMVVGGGNSAVDAANDLAKIARQVYLIHYRNKLKADQVLIEKMLSNKNLSVHFNHRLIQINGKTKVEKGLIEETTNGKITELTADGVFIEIGSVPNSNLVTGLVDLNQNNEIIVDYHCATSKHGIFAAGDVTNVPFKQIVIAAGEGAKAGLAACEYISKL